MSLYVFETRGRSAPKAILTAPNAPKCRPEANRKPSRERGWRDRRAARVADRSDPHTGCNRHARDAIAGSDAAGSGEDGSKRSICRSQSFANRQFERGGSSLPRKRMPQIRHMVFATWQWHQPCRPYGTVRASRQIATRFRQSYAGRGLALHAGDRRRRARCRARDGGRTLFNVDADDIWRGIDWVVAGLGQRQGRHSRTAATSRRGRRSGQNHRIPRRRAAKTPAG